MPSAFSFRVERFDIFPPWLEGAQNDEGLDAFRFFFERRSKRASKIKNLIEVIESSSDQQSTVVIT